jgi:hypothetical protein
MVHSLLQRLNKFARRAEDLQLVVLGSAHHKPGIILVPVKVADSVGKATMHEQTNTYEHVK